MHVLQTGIKNKLRIDVRARPVTSYQHCLPLLGAVQLLRYAPGGGGGSAECDTLWQGEGGVRPSVT